MKHDEAFPPRSRDRLPIRRHRSAVRFLQTGNDIEESRFATAAGPDDANELGLGHVQTHLIERKHSSGAAAKTFRYLLN